MSIPYINMVLASPEPHGSANRLCLLVLADHANAQGYCWPSQATLAQKCAVSKRAIQYTLDRLEASDHIRVEHRSGRSSVYWIIAETLTPEGRCQSQDGVAHEAHCGSTDEADCVAPPEVHCQPPTKPTATEPQMNHQLEPSTEPLRSVGSEKEVGLESDASSIVARLRAGGERDPRLEEKVASLIALHGIHLVASQFDGLARQYADTAKGFGIGLLVQAVNQPEKYHFSEPAPVAGSATLARPQPGTPRTREQAAALDAAGITSPDDWRSREDGDFVLWYVPHDVLRDDATTSMPNIPLNGLGVASAADRGKSGRLQASHPPVSQHEPSRLRKIEQRIWDRTSKQPTQTTSEQPP